MKLILFILFNFAFCFAVADKLRVGISPALSSAGVYLALENGYFKSENLDVELVTVANSGAAMTLLLSKNELDVGGGNLSSGLFNAILSGEKFKLVADKGHSAVGHEYIALVVREDLIQSGKFKTLKDLKGMKIGLTALDGVSQQIVFEKMLSSVGLDSKDVTYLKLSYPEMNTALKTKALDATIQIEPYLAAGVQDRVFRIIETSQKYAPDQQSAAIFFSPKMSTAKRNEGVRFMMAYLRGIRLYNSALIDKQLWKKVSGDLKKHIQISNDELWDKMAAVGLRDDGKLNVSSIMSDLKWYQDKNYVPSPIAEGQLIDDSFVVEAVRLLEKKKELN